MMNTRFLVAAMAAALLGSATAAAAPPASATAIESAVAARKAGRFDEAAAALQAWLQTHPEDARAQHELGVLFAIHGQLPAAAGRFEAALRSAPAQAETRRALADVLRSADRCADAQGHYRQLLVDDVGDAAAWRGLVLCDQASGQLDRADRTCAEIEQRFAGKPLATWATARRAQLAALRAGGGAELAQADAEGKALFAEKRYEDAIVWFEVALGRAPTADRAYRLAMARLGDGDLLGAMGALQHGLRLDPSHMATLSAWPTIARSARAQGSGGLDVDFAASTRTPLQHIAAAVIEGDVVLARQVIQAARQRGLKGAVLATLDGEVALLEGQIARAVVAFQEALAARPGYPAARKGMAQALFLQGRYGEARDQAGLPAPAALPASGDANDDLRRFAVLRRAELVHQLRMSLDPGVKPLPALADQLAETAPPPPAPPAAQVTPVPEPPPDAKVKPARRKASPPKPSKSGTRRG